MKKHKILVVALAMAVMLLGTGYAYWTQTLTINNTVNTGKLDVSFVCPTDVDSWDDGIPTGNHSDLVTVDAVRTGQNIQFTVGNFYPGAGASLDFAIKNTGTVPAKISTVTGNVTNNQALCDALNYQFTKVLVIDPQHGPNYLDIQDVNANNVSDLAAGLTGALKDIIIPPNGFLVLIADNPGHGSDESANPGYNILMPASISGSDFETSSASFTLGLDFTQVN